MEHVATGITILLIAVFIASIHQSIRLSLNKTTPPLLKALFITFILFLIFEINFSPNAIKKGWDFSDSPMYKATNVILVLLPLLRGVITGFITYLLHKNSFGKYRIALFASVAIVSLYHAIELLIAINTPMWP